MFVHLKNYVATQMCAYVR